MLDESLRRHAQTALDALYVDPSETEPAKRVFFFNGAIPPPRTCPGRPKQNFAPAPSCTNSRSRIGGKIWQVLYRPRPSWIAEVDNGLPRWLLAVGLAGSAALAGWVFQLTRRTAVVEQLVTERTREVIEGRRELTGFLHALPGMAFRGRYDDKFTLFYVSDGSGRAYRLPAGGFPSRRPRASA